MPEYVLLASSATGLHLCDGGGGDSLGLRAHCDDSCTWQWREPGRRLENAATGAVVSVEPGGEPPPAPGSAEAAALDAQFGAGASLLVPQTYRLVDADRALEGLGGELLFAARDAPGRLPSVYMAELESQGWTVVDKIMSPTMVDNLVANITAVREANAEKEARVRAKQDQEPYSANGNAISPAQLGGRPGSPLSFLGMTPVVAQAAMHPVSLWLIENYLRVDDIHYCQVPALKILRPAEKTGDAARVEPGGWHSDYPYPLTAETDYHTFMLGPEEGDRLDASIATRYPDWKNRKARLGMQFNIALTDFTPETGGTQFVLGSHEFDTPPPTEMNNTPTVAGEGVFADVVQVPFPAGSGILYDSRTYHRAPPELNVSGEERWAMLTCIVPSFVRDLRARDDKDGSAEAFARSTAVHKHLTPREAKDVLKMLCDDEAGQPRENIERTVLGGRAAL